MQLLTEEADLIELTEKLMKSVDKSSPLTTIVDGKNFHENVKLLFILFQ